MSVVIVDYGVGNLASIANMVKRAGGRAEISSIPEVISEASSLIFPGVGSFDAARAEIDARGLAGVLHSKARVERVPVLGICVGMQLMATESQEGRLPGLGWLDTRVVRFDDMPPLRLPCIGWNAVEVDPHCPLLTGLQGRSFYFLHSYRLASEGYTSAWAEYGVRYPAAIQFGNLFGTQFHPEKSGDAGLHLFRNFLSLSAS